jgi:hypothetical protein
MKIKPFTPAIRMQRTAILRKSQPWFADVAVEYGVTDDEIYLALLDFASVSLRVNGHKKKLDFDLIVPSDTPDVVRDKFVAYLNTTTTGAVYDIERAMREYDAPVDPALAPDMEPDDPEA